MRKFLVLFLFLIMYRATVDEFKEVQQRTLTGPLAFLWGTKFMFSGGEDTYGGINREQFCTQLRNFYCLKLRIYRCFAMFSIVTITYFLDIIVFGEFWSSLGFQYILPSRVTLPQYKAPPSFILDQNFKDLKWALFWADFILGGDVVFLQIKSR